jgi:hypothetical protein
MGIAYDESTLEVSWYTPTAASWRNNDRTAQCILDDPAGRLVDTMKGSQR